MTFTVIERRLFCCPKCWKEEHFAICDKSAALLVICQDCKERYYFDFKTETLYEAEPIDTNTYAMHHDRFLLTEPCV